MAQQTEFVPYEQALELRQLGFDNLPLYYYNSDGDITPFISFVSNIKPNNQSLFEGVCYAPLYQQAFRWFREKGYRFTLSSDYENGIFFFDVWKNNQFMFETDYIYNTYEEAELACLIKLIEIVKQKS